MSNCEIVETIARDRLVERIIHNITEGNCKDPSALNDLAQDIYVSLLEDEKLPVIYGEGHINYYVTRIVLNNVVSSSSPFYRNYLRPQNMSVTLDERINIPDGNN